MLIRFNEAVASFICFADITNTLVTTCVHTHTLTHIVLHSGFLITFSPFFSRSSSSPPPPPLGQWKISRDAGNDDDDSSSSPFLIQSLPLDGDVEWHTLATTCSDKSCKAENERR